MSRNSNGSDSKALSLRRNAESRLKTGSAPRAGGVPLDKEALSLLYQMASDPDRSSDALRLLHELQVHQVELDLQREQLETSEYEMSQELALYRTMFERAPTVSLVTTTEGRIIEANPAAASVLKTRQSELLGQALHELVRQESRAAWRELLQKLETGEQAVSCEVLVDTRDNETVKLKLSGSILPEGGVLLFGVVS